jgi:hypothetical protein
MFGMAVPGSCGMMGRTLCILVHAVEVPRYRAARPPASLAALCSGDKGITTFSPFMGGAVAGLRLARERAVYGFLAVVLCRFSS